MVAGSVDRGRDLQGDAGVRGQAGHRPLAGVLVVRRARGRRVAHVGVAAGQLVGDLDVRGRVGAGARQGDGEGDRVAGVGGGGAHRLVQGEVGLRVVDGDRRRVGNETVVVLDRVVDRGRVAGEAGLRGEGDVAVVVDAPGALTGDGDLVDVAVAVGVLSGAAGDAGGIEVYGGRVDGAVRVGVVTGGGQGDRLADLARAAVVVGDGGLVNGNRRIAAELRGVLVAVGRGARNEISRTQGYTCRNGEVARKGAISVRRTAPNEPVTFAVGLALAVAAEHLAVVVAVVVRLVYLDGVGTRYKLPRAANVAFHVEGVALHLGAGEDGVVHPHVLLVGCRLAVVRCDTIAKRVVVIVVPVGLIQIDGDAAVVVEAVVGDVVLRARKVVVRIVVLGHHHASGVVAGHDVLAEQVVGPHDACAVAFDVVGPVEVRVAVEVAAVVAHRVVGEGVVTGALPGVDTGPVVVHNAVFKNLNAAGTSFDGDAVGIEPSQPVGVGSFVLLYNALLHAVAVDVDGLVTDVRDYVVLDLPVGC